MTKRQFDFNSVVNGFNSNNGGFNFINGFNNFNQQRRVIQVQEQSLQIIDNGGRQQIVQQVEQVLVVDRVNNGFNSDLNDLFRKSNFRNQFRNVATVVLVVQEIQVIIDDRRRGRIQQNLFAQRAIVANRGARQTQTVMIFDSRKLIAQDILGNNAFNNIGRFGGIAGATGVINANLPVKTDGVQVFDVKPTWTAMAQDPAETLGSIWQDALQDQQKADADKADNQLNQQIAQQEMKAMQQAMQKQNQTQTADNAQQKANAHKQDDAQK